MPVDVRRIRSDEAAILKTIRLAALQDTPSAFGSTYASEADRTDEEWATRAVTGSTGNDRAIFLGWNESQPVGIVGGYREEAGARTVELVSMWTSPDARRTGLGRLLVQTVLDWASETGAASVELWVTRGNVPAQQLYESIGFRETGDHQPLPSDPCADEVRMKMTIGDQS